jgi:hypothetical protein
MSKRRSGIALKLSTLALFTTPAITLAAEPSSPYMPSLEVGLIGSYTNLEFEGGRTDRTTYVPEGGVYLALGNKLRATSGFIYQAQVNARYASSSDEQIKDSLADLDLGWRMALDARNAVDIIVGAGYRWNRFEPHIDGYNIKLTSRSPQAKLGLGYSHRFANTTVRIEAGVRRNVNGESQLKISRVGNETVDLKDRNNPYVELGFLFNREGNWPVTASMYYTEVKYDLDGRFLISEFDQQTRKEAGFKVGMVF